MDNKSKPGGNLNLADNPINSTNNSTANKSNKAINDASKSNVKEKSAQSGTKQKSGQKSGSSKRKEKVKKLKVLFVCTGNTCRSPMAEQLFKHFLKKRKQLSAYDVSSAGLYAEPDSRINPFAVKALANLGLKPQEQKSRQLTETMAESADIIVCMTLGHKSAIDGHNYIFSVGELTGGGDVPDPYGADIEKYTTVARYLEYACGDIYSAAEKLRK